MFNFIKNISPLHLVKTWSENTREGETYLRWNRYRRAKRIGNSELYICVKLGTCLDDVQIVF